jgi:large repetitive protein
LAGGDSTVEGLAINQFNNAIHLESLGGDSVTGNFIGTDSTGENAENDGNDGVLVDNVPNNTIGGTTPADRNVISASNDAGVELNGSSSTGNLVADNLIGTDSTGTLRLGNVLAVAINNNASGNVVGEPGAGNLISASAFEGIGINGGCNDNVVQANAIGTEINGTVGLPNYGGGLQIGGSGNTIGGTTSGTGNLISGNGSDGIEVGGGSGNLIEGNLIGTDITGTQPLGNGGYGVEVSSSNNTIGGLAAGAGNIIAFSERAGVGVPGGTGNAILSNSIYDNGALGIDLGENGVTVNTPGGPHTGPNELQNFPVILAAVAFTDTGSSIITGTLNSAAAAGFTLQFFASTTADPSGYGQGETLLATTTVTTDSSGNASFRVSVPLLIPAGDAVSATATDSSGDTSEFAQDFTAIATTDRVAAINDSYSTDVNTKLTVPAPGVQTNDVSSDGGSFTSVLVAGPAHGQLTLDSDGAFTYTPAHNFVGTDTFTYEDDQQGQHSNVATVTLTVNPKTLYVTNTNDSGPGSLRQAMLIAAGSNSPAPDTILFDIPGAGQAAPVQGALVITIDSPLPVVSHPTIIDGYSQPGSYENTLAQGDNAVIRIELSPGSSLARGNNGFVLTAAGSTIEGLSIIESVNQFASAILISGGDDDVFGNFITGSVFGVQIAGSSGNSVGGTNPGERNVISGNSQQGILITGGSSANAVRGNYIGTDVTGTQANGNNNGGVSVLDSPDNTIGGSASGAGNVISGNGQDGVLISSAGNGPGSPGTVIQGNDIGVDSTGELDLGNNRNGIEIVYGTGTLIGGAASGDRNIISGNQAGVYLQNTASYALIEGNYVGTDARGFKAIGNQFDGVLLSGSGNTVGGTATGAGNLISGNGRAGVSDGRWSTSTGSNLIEGNLIGTDSSGTVALANHEDGIDLGTNGDTIGGTTAAARNVISANALDGINITGPSGSELIEGNNIGTDATGTEPLGNGQFGILITGDNNTVGGLTARAGNVIAYSGDAGVEIASGGESNVILTNSIFANSGMGIVTNGSGNQPYPVLTSAVSTHAGTTIQGSLTADPDETYLIQFFSNPQADPSGFGQGQNYLGSLYVTTDSSGAASFQFTTKPAVPMGYVLSATATSSSSTTAQFPNTTSQFSADLTVTGPSATPPAAGTSTSASDPSSTFTVTTTAGDSGVGSLGWAIDQVDADASDSTSRPDTIKFDIPGQGPFLIQLSQSLPAITNPVIIDGFSEPGAHPNTLTRGDNAIIQIQVDGSFIGGSNGLVLAAGDSTINGLSLTDFNSAIVVSGVSGDHISGNFLGVRPTGYNTGSNDFGVQISDGSSNSIGGAAPAARNLISGNNNWGIQISDGSTDNVVAGNEIGTNLTGSGTMRNGNGGVSVLDSPDNTIGGPASGAGNVISGNSGDGIQLSSVDQGAGSTDTVIQGNLIGLDATGAIILLNNSSGVEVDFGSGTLIGGTRPGDGNVISGNAAQGIFIQPPVTGVLIEGNDIGTNATRTAALGNSDNGILLGGGMNTVGGTSNGAGNLISGNGNDGISDGVFSFVNSVGHSLIEGNLIGTSGAGTLGLPNEQDGIVLDEDGDTVGGTTAAARNVVSGNDQYGIDITNNNFGTMNVVEGNDVGTDVTGTQPLGNLQGGIYVTATDNTIGGPTASAANVIAFNGSFGVEIDQGAVNDSILTNSINANSGPGIVLSENGNDNQPAPALTSAVSSPSSTIVQGTLTAAPETTYLIQLFANHPAGSSGIGSGPGQIFLLDISVTTDGSGAATFSAKVKPPVEPGYTIAATATSSTGNTSAFSAAVSVTVGPASVSMSDVAVGSVSDASASTLADLVLGTLAISPTDQLDTVLTDLAVDQVQAKGHGSIPDS